MYVAMT